MQVLLIIAIQSQPRSALLAKQIGELHDLRFPRSRRLTAREVPSIQHWFTDAKGTQARLHGPNPFTSPRITHQPDINTNSRDKNHKKWAFEKDKTINTLTFYMNKVRNELKKTLNLQRRSLTSNGLVSLKGQKSITSLEEFGTQHKLKTLDLTDTSFETLKTLKGQPWLREALEGMLDDLSKEDIHELANHVMTTVLAPPQ